MKRPFRGKRSPQTLDNWAFRRSMTCPARPRLWQSREVVIAYCERPVVQQRADGCLSIIMYWRPEWLREVLSVGHFFALLRLHAIGGPARTALQREENVAGRP